MLERQVEAYLSSQVKRAGGICWKWTGMAGVPDRIAILPGGVVALIEVKTEGGRISAIQAVVHGKIRALGIPVFVVYNKAQISVLLDHLQGRW
ncbi:MAG: VRR-NUC domain-containing protein [Fluviibacter phosphoraccumulans]